MKCLVFSDSHGLTMYMRRAIERNTDAEVVFFLGDGLEEVEHLAESYPQFAWICVRGNCDRTSIFCEREVSKVERITLLGKKIVLTHGDLYNAKFDEEPLVGLGIKEEADIVLFGHTHYPHEEYIPYEKKPFYLFNPGSIGLSGASFGVITLLEGQEPLLSHGSFL